MALTPWKPGQSGNPNGHGTAAMKLAAYVRSLAGQDGKVYLDILHDIAAKPHKDVKTRITALGMLLDRGWGKPKEHIQLEGSLSSLTLTPEAVAKLSDAELAQAVSVVLRLRELAAEGTTLPQDAPGPVPPMETPAPVLEAPSGPQEPA